MERENRATFTVVAYLLPSACFEVEYDWREEVVFVLIGRPWESSRPPGYYMHDGQRVRTHLGEALTQAGLADRPTRDRLRAAMKPSGAQAMREQVNVLSSTLRDHIDELLARLDRVFD